MNTYGKTLIKKTIIILTLSVVFFSIFSPCVSALTAIENIELVPNKTTVYAGEELIVSAKFNCSAGSEGIISINGSIEYDTDIFEALTTESLYCEWDDEPYFSSIDNHFTVSSDDTLMTSGEFLKITFKAKKDLDIDFPIKTKITLNILAIRSLGSVEMKDPFEKRTTDVEVTVGYKTADDIFPAFFDVIDDKYIKTTDLDKTVLIILNNIKTDKVVKIYTADKKESSHETPLATGMIVEIDNFEYKIVVSCDLSGDGKLTALDLSKMKLHLVNISELVNEYKIAADINGNGGVTALDLSQLKLKLVGLT